jgi:Zn-dependent M16 (insulinase) family peptidase
MATLPSSYADLFKEINAQIKTAGEAQARAISGGSAEAQRQAAAQQAVASQRYGITGSPTATALSQKVNERIMRDTQSKLDALRAQTAQQQANVTQTLGVANIQDQLARDMAYQQMIGNIISGLGSTAGSLMGNAGSAATAALV